MEAKPTEFRSAANVYFRDDAETFILEGGNTYLR